MTLYLSQNANYSGYATSAAPLPIAIAYGNSCTANSVTPLSSPYRNISSSVR